MCLTPTPGRAPARRLSRLTEGAVSAIGPATRITSIANNFQLYFIQYTDGAAGRSTQRRERQNGMRRITRTRELGAASGAGTAISPRRHPTCAARVWGLPIALLSERCHAQRGTHPVGLFHLERAGGRVGEVCAWSRRLGRHVSREGAGEHRRHAPRRPPPPASCARCPRLLPARPPRPPLGPAWSSSSCLPRS